MSDKKAWKYCVIGNIVRTQIDQNGVLRHGTSAFSGGTKVYLCGKLWDQSSDEISVLGLSRGKKYLVTEIPVTQIEHVRCSRAFNPAVLEIMENWEFWECWWHNTQEDKRSTEKFVQTWNQLHQNLSESSDERQKHTWTAEHSERLHTADSVVYDTTSWEEDLTEEQREILAQWHQEEQKELLEWLQELKDFG